MREQGRQGQEGRGLGREGRGQGREGQGQGQEGGGGGLKWGSKSMVQCLLRVQVPLSAFKCQGALNPDQLNR